MSEIKSLTAKIKAFRDARDWKQFHNHKDVALSLVLEASEVLEHFQWKSPKEVEEHGIEAKDELADQLLAQFTSFHLNETKNLKVSQLVIPLFA